MEVTNIKLINLNLLIKSSWLFLNSYSISKIYKYIKYNAFQISSENLDSVQLIHKYE